MWSEIRCDYYDDIERKWCVDAWETPNDNEEGVTIAKIDDNGNVEYLDPEAQYDEYAQEEINAKVAELQEDIERD